MILPRGEENLEFFQLQGMVADPGQTHPLVIANRAVVFGQRQSFDMFLDPWCQSQKVKDLRNARGIKLQFPGQGRAGQSGSEVQELF